MPPALSSATSPTSTPASLPSTTSWWLLGGILTGLLLIGSVVRPTPAKLAGEAAHLAAPAPAQRAVPVSSFMQAGATASHHAAL